MSTENGRLDPEETHELRERGRADRLCRGRPFDEFVEEWESRRPPDTILEQYGEWPHGLRARG